MFCLEFFRRTIFDDPSVVDDNDPFCFLSEVNSIRHKHDGFSPLVEVTLETIVEDVFANIGVQSTQTIINKVNIGISIQSSSYGYSLLLSSR